MLEDNEPLGAKGPLLVGEGVRKKDVGKVGSSYTSIIHDNILLHKCWDVEYTIHVKLR